MILQTIEQCLQKIYRIDLPLTVADFLIDQKTLEALMGGKRCRIAHPRSEGFLLVSESGDGIRLAVYLSGKIIDNLTSNDPCRSLNSKNLGDFCTAIEEISHFAYTAWNALRTKPVTPLELELQSEVDKFVTCYFFLDGQGQRGFLAGLKVRLFESFCLPRELGSEQRIRYLTANRYARHYCRYLERFYIRSGSLDGMMRDLRRFYRLGLGDKLYHIQHPPLP